MTNTPLQALVLMNDPTYMEAARSWPNAIFAKRGPNETERIRFVFRLATDRDPSPKELDILRGALSQTAGPLSNHPGPTRKSCWRSGNRRTIRRQILLSLPRGPLVASTILNLDETITKN